MIKEVESTAVAVVTKDITVEVSTPEGVTTYNLNPEVLYQIVRPNIALFMTGGASANPDENRVKSLVKVAVKGVMIMYGRQILDTIFASKEHDNPGKHDDIILWYTDMFTKVAIAMWMKNKTILTGNKVEGKPDVIQVSQIHTRPTE